MKRKVVQHGPSSLIMSLPSKWVKSYNIQKGDELEVIEKGNVLEISTGSVVKGKSVTIDISNLNKTSIVIYLQSMYRYGYDEINVRFTNQTALHHRKEKEIPVIDILQEVIALFIGVEIVKQTKDLVQIKQLSEDSEKDFEMLKRRVIFLTTEVFQEFDRSIKDDNNQGMMAIANYHRTIVKFINYCMRLLNRGTVRDLSDSLTLYHLLAVIDRIVDCLREAARVKVQRKITFSKGAQTIITQVVGCMYQYQTFFFKNDLATVEDLERKRHNLKKAILNHSAKHEEIIALSLFKEVVELLQDAVECRLRLKGSV